VSEAVAFQTDPRIDALLALRTPLLRALRRAGDTHTVGDIIAMIQRGAAQFFGDDRGACITEVTVYPRRKVMNIWLAIGELDACLSLIPQMEEFARQQGCTALTECGREGWEPFLAKRGWTRYGLVMMRDIQS
jgi:hypothetical protein